MDDDPDVFDVDKTTLRRVGPYSAVDHGECVTRVCISDDPAIVAALAIAHAAREAGLVDGDRLRKIVGTVPVTADGVIVGGDVMQLWSKDGRKITLGRWCGPLSCTPEEIERDGECVNCPHWVGVMHLYFSNPSAAERAAKEKPDAR